jgi:nicotinamide mononucleotide transporter
MGFFEIENVAIRIWSYPVSYVELIGTMFGLASVYLAARGKILTWATGIANEFFLFILFFKVQLYADMFLQVYFFVTTLYGWRNWATNPAEKEISEVGMKNKARLAIAIIAASLLFGYLFSNIHLYFPAYFKVKAAYPVIDSFVMTASIVATILLAKKKMENWYLWIIVDIVCTVLYCQKAVYFLAIEYFVFLGLALYGLYNWRKQLKDG